MSVENDFMEKILEGMKTKEVVVRLLSYQPVYALDIMKRGNKPIDFNGFMKDLKHDLELFESYVPELKGSFESDSRLNDFEYFSYYFLKDIQNQYNRSIAIRPIFNNKLSLLNELKEKGIPVLAISESFSGSIMLEDFTIIVFESVDQVLEEYAKNHKDTVNVGEQFTTECEKLLAELTDRKHRAGMNIMLKNDAAMFRTSAKQAYETCIDSEEVYQTLTVKFPVLMEEFQKLNNGEFYTFEAFCKIINKIIHDLADSFFYKDLDSWIENNYSDIYDKVAKVYDGSLYVADNESYAQFLEGLTIVKNDYILPFRSF